MGATTSARRFRIAQRRTTPDPIADRPNANFYAVLREHAGLIATVATGLIVLFRLFSMSGGNGATAMAIAHENGTAGILVGAFLGFLPIAIASTSAAILTRTLYRLVRARQRPGYLHFYLIFTVTVITATIVPAAYFLLYVPLGALTGIAFGFMDRSVPSESVRDSQIIILSVLVLPFIFTMIMSTNSWLPTEVVETNDPAHAKLVGYVIKSDGETFSLLVDDPRSMVYLSPDAIKKRTICGHFAWHERPFFSALDSRSNAYAECPASNG